MPHIFDYSQSFKGVVLSDNKVFGDVTSTATLPAQNLFWGGSQTITRTSTNIFNERFAVTVAQVAPDQAFAIQEPTRPNVWVNDPDRTKGPPDFRAAADNLAFITPVPDGSSAEAYLSFPRLAPFSFTLDVPDVIYSEDNPVIDAVTDSIARGLRAAEAQFAQLAEVNLSEAGVITGVLWTPGRAKKADIKVEMTPDPEGKSTVGDLIGLSSWSGSYNGVTVAAAKFNPADSVRFVLTDKNDDFGGFLDLDIEQLDIRAGKGRDTVDLLSNTDAIVPKTISINGGDGRDFLSIAVRESADIRGGNGNDDIVVALWDVDGDPTTAEMRGQAGNDTIFNASGNKKLRYDAYGGTGDDVVMGDFAGGRVDGGQGNDQISVGMISSPDRVIWSQADTALFGGRGRDSILGGAGDDTLYGGPGQDTLRGGNGTDTLVGGPGHDRLAGERGDDLLLGGRGADTLIGGAGADVLQGGRQNDLLSGGKGPDTFVMRPGDGTDTITDFAPAVDTLDTGGADLDRSTRIQGDLELTYGAFTVVLAGLGGVSLDELNII